MTCSERVALLRATGGKALVLFVTAGDPSLEQLPMILETLAMGGADIIEVGIPFSDPIADGPTIQASSQRALDLGTTPGRALEALAKARAGVPLVMMGYYNTVLRLGLERSAKLFKDAGIEASIVSDLTPEESDGWISASNASGLENVFLAAPTSTDERLDEVCNRASGFVYAVSRTGVTGAGSQVPPEVSELVGRIKARTKLPVCVGFGISKPEHVSMVCEVAEGAVIGSALVDWLHRNWKDGEGRNELLELVESWKEATRV